MGFTETYEKYKLTKNKDVSCIINMTFHMMMYSILHDRWCTTFLHTDVFSLHINVSSPPADVSSLQID